MLERGPHSTYGGHRSRERYNAGDYGRGHGSSLDRGRNYGEEYHLRRGPLFNYGPVEVEDAPVTFGEPSGGNCYRHGDGHYGTGANTPDMYGGPPWPDRAIGSETSTDGWDEIPSPPRSASPARPSPIIEISPTYSRSHEEDAHRRHDDYATPPPYRGYGGHATPFAIFGYNDYRSSSPPGIFPPPCGYNDDSTHLSRGDNRNLHNPDDNVPPPPFGYPLGRVVRDSYLEEESELERRRQDYVRQMENFSFHLRRDNRRLREELMRTSPNSGGHRPSETYEEGQPSELRNEGNRGYPYDYNGFGWKGDY